MKHCHLSIMCNELIFLKQKLNFLYENFDQIIFVDYDILNKQNSTDGSIEYLENFDDPENKLHLIKFTENDNREITNFRGVSMIEKRKMFAKGSLIINDDIDFIWSTDMDEFFDKKLISIVEDEFNNDSQLATLNIPHYIFVYNQYNIFKGESINGSSYICPPRITKHVKGKIYGHCNFQNNGKCVKCEKEFIYHFAWVGVNRIKHKNQIYNQSNNERKREIGESFLKKYLMHLINNKKTIDIFHTNLDLNMKSIEFNQVDKIPEYINIEEMISELNSI